MKPPTGDVPNEIDSLRTALDALRASEELKTRLIESSRDCIKVLDLDANLLSINAGGMEVLEICDLGPLLHTSWLQFWDGPERELATRALEEARAGRIGRFVGFCPTQRGTPKWWDVVVNAILDGDGRPQRLLAVSRDISELKRAQDVLRQAHAELERRVEERTASLAEANARLQRQVEERQRAEATLRAVVEGVESQLGERFFPSLVRHLAQALGVRYAFVSELTREGTHFRTLAVWGNGGPMDNLEVPIDGTPCEAVLVGQSTHYPERLQQLFPRDVGLVEWQAHSYAGVPLLDSNGAVAGHLAIFDDRPMPDGSRALSIMRIFAARACAEIERARAGLALRASEERLARVIESAMDAIVTIDAQKRIILLNGAAEKIFGCRAQDWLGRSLDPLLSPKLARALEEAVEGCRRGVATQPYLWGPDGLTARRADAVEFPVEATLSHVEVGGETLFTLILRDVDERQRTQESLRQLHQENVYLQEEIRAAHNVDEIVGESRSLAEVLKQVTLVAVTDSSVLLLGESGTGKELIARAVHARSQRRDHPLIKVNCAALPTGLIESELFGHEKGAFTGAAARRIGRFELAHGGTIFLDEIGEMPLDVQVKLLRVLQEREIERVGGSETIRIDVRVIAATNRDLSDAVANGSFRRDLFYRLNVFPIRLPALRERRDDIPLLAHYFVARFAVRIGRRIRRIPPEVVERLVGYSWPGNVRELENVIERAVILSGGPDLELAPELLPAVAVPSIHPPPPEDFLTPGGSLEAIERNHILSVLRQVGWRIDGPNGAARVLNLNPSTLRSRIKKLGIRRSSDFA